MPKWCFQWWVVDLGQVGEHLGLGIKGANAATLGALSSTVTRRDGRYDGFRRGCGQGRGTGCPITWWLLRWCKYSGCWDCTGRKMVGSLGGIERHS